MSSKKDCRSVVRRRVSYADFMWLHDGQKNRIHVLQFVCLYLVLLDARGAAGKGMQCGFTTDRKIEYISYNSSVRRYLVLLDAKLAARLQKQKLLHSCYC